MQITVPMPASTPWYISSEAKRGGTHIEVSGGVEAGAADSVEPGRELHAPVEPLGLVDAQARGLEHDLPLRLRVAAHVTRIAESLGLLRRLVEEDVVLDHDLVARDAG